MLIIIADGYCHLDYVHRRGAEHIRYEVTHGDCHSERRSEGRENRSERVPPGRIERDDDPGVG